MKQIVDTIKNSLITDLMINQNNIFVENWYRGNVDSNEQIDDSLYVMIVEPDSMIVENKPFTTKKGNISVYFYKPHGTDDTTGEQRQLIYNDIEINYIEPFISSIKCCAQFSGISTFELNYIYHKFNCNDIGIKITLSYDAVYCTNDVVVDYKKLVDILNNSKLKFDISDNKINIADI